MTQAGLRTFKVAAVSDDDLFIHLKLHLMNSIYKKEALLTKHI